MIKNKKMFELAQKQAAKTFKVNLHGETDYQRTTELVTQQTGYKNLLASSIAGGLIYVGWRACNIDGVNTLFIAE